VKICRTVEEMAAYSRQNRSSGEKLGLVPTMGALHDGHMSLVKHSVADNDTTVVSIFVNPTQFAPDEDLDEYPRDLVADSAKLEEAGVDCLFLPEPNTMYPEGYKTYVIQEELPDALCGASRPGHFRGVLTVVLKLFNIVMPSDSYFGRKDYQQSVVIQQMVTDLDLPVHIHVLPVIREADGLAMSSRNRYLSLQERTDALCLYRSLCAGRDIIGGGETSAAAVTREMSRILEGTASSRVDYLAVVEPDTLKDVSCIERPVVLAAAVYIGNVRLIDNLSAGPRI
jgi:pantoate--beta-alanine ligase